MASGIGIQGGRSRCYAFWQEYFDCYVQADHPKQCSLDLDNYIECLHHTKEKARIQRIREEWAKQQKAGRLPRDSSKVELSDEDSKKLVSRLGFIDGSFKQKERTNNAGKGDGA